MGSVLPRHARRQVREQTGLRDVLTWRSMVAPPHAPHAGAGRRCVRVARQGWLHHNIDEMRRRPLEFIEVATHRRKQVVVKRAVDATRRGVCGVVMRLRKGEERWVLEACYDPCRAELEMVNF